MIIVFSGMRGSGKTTIGKDLADELGYNFYSMGTIKRKLALEKGMTLEEFNEILAKDSTIDRQVDEYQTKLGEREDNFVMDSWVGFHFIPKAFKILLKCEPDIAAKRIMAGHTRLAESYNGLDELKVLLNKLTEQDKGRFSKYYGITNLFDESHYDFALDTSNINKKQAINIIKDELIKRNLIGN